MSPEENSRFTEIEEDYMLLLETNNRFEANGNKPTVAMEKVLEDLGRRVVYKVERVDDVIKIIVVYLL